MQPRFTVLVAFAAACGRESRPPTAAIAALRDTLVRIGVEDQAGRDSVGVAIAANDTGFIKRLLRDDSARTRWLQRILAVGGWPRRSVVGDTAANAAWLVVQHSPMHDFQEQMLALLEAEENRGEVKAADVAMLSDRVRVHRQEPQRYGTQFSVKGKVFVADSIAELIGLDSVRASVGLPPMTEYVRMLAQMFRMPVEWPPSTGRLVRP